MNTFMYTIVGILFWVGVIASMNKDLKNASK